MASMKIVIYWPYKVEKSKTAKWNCLARPSSCGVCAWSVFHNNFRVFVWYIQHSSDLYFRPKNRSPILMSPSLPVSSIQHMIRLKNSHRLNLIQGMNLDFVFRFKNLVVVVRICAYVYDISTVHIRWIYDRLRVE